jgi:hypothetical protein
MSDPIRRRRMTLYFARLRLKPLLFLAVATFVLGGFSETLLLVGLGVCLAYVLLLIWLWMARPSDGQMDVWLAEDLRSLRRRAMVKLDLATLDEDPFEIVGPFLQVTDHIRPKNIKGRRGRDGVFRLSVNRVLILFPTEHHLGIYSCVFDSLRDTAFHINAKEYAYRNVVAVSCGEDAEVFDGDQARQYELPDGRAIVPTQVFSLSVSSGETLRVPVRARLAQENHRGLPPATELDKVVSRMRAMLRAKYQPT